ncbi:MAG TPA: nuclear transport factor 2 family protein [Polyangiaceae bacterium]|nr:nuclear transport factor 2 family protein [Polyangiaceae bacterium]
MTPATPSDSDVLIANARFYDAFTEGDFDEMADLWAEHAPVSCIHPLSPALSGRKAILETWKEILRSPPPVALRCERPTVHRLSTEVAIVTCYEGEGTHPAHLAATNVFAIEGGRWRMVHHHAGPLSRPIRPAPERPTLN